MMMIGVRPKETLSMQTRDGIRLDADVYRPDAEAEFPVLLMRQPYGRAIASTVVYAHPIWYAAHGYIVVIQDVRGRGTSEGTFRLFANEIEDGEDTVRWASTLPGSNGTVGMYGFSYQGMTQLYAAANRPEALKVLCPAMLGYDLYADWAYEGGAFCLQASLGWAIQLAAETARRAGDVDAYQTLYKAARSPLACDPVSGYSAILNDLAPESFYHEWLAHPEPGEYWDAISPCRYIQDVDLPMLHIGGWYDTYLRGTIRCYQEMAHRCESLQQLWIGPWAHIPWGRQVGQTDFGVHANSMMDEVQIQWFDHFLKGTTTPIMTEPPVHVFEMGRNHWRSLLSWPSPSLTPLFLQSSGLASIQQDSGMLRIGRSPMSEGAVDGSQEDGALPDTIVHDPWRPVPSTGGHASLPTGPANRADVDCRSDVLTYTSPPLQEEWRLLGEGRVSIVCSADTESFDLCAVLSEVYPDGRVMTITEGYARITPGHTDTQPVTATPLEHPKFLTPYPPQEHCVVLQPTCIAVPRGHALRLSLSAASFPAHPVNSGKLGHSEGVTPPVAPDLLTAQIITVFVWTGSADQSYLCLPVEQNQASTS
jgi:putative CocE/NonD family hydrolase